MNSRIIYVCAAVASQDIVDCDHDATATATMHIVRSRFFLKRSAQWINLLLFLPILPTSAFAGFIPSLQKHSTIFRRSSIHLRSDPSSDVDNRQYDDPTYSIPIKSTAATGIVPALFVSSMAVLLIMAPVVHAAPPIAVIAEELGYFPIQSKDGQITYIPQRVKRTSTDQAVQMADYLHQRNIILAGTYWCPHTSRQKELLGREASSRVEYIECSSKGYHANTAFCMQNNIEAYPTWIDGTKQLQGEQSLRQVAEFAGYDLSRWDDNKEQANPPPPLGGAECK